MTTKTTVGKEATAKPRKRKEPRTSQAELELALEMIHRAGNKDST